jgi:hypothetical protein
MAISTTHLDLMSAKHGLWRDAHREHYSLYPGLYQRLYRMLQAPPTEELPP